MTESNKQKQTKHWRVVTDKRIGVCNDMHECVFETNFKELLSTVQKIQKEVQKKKNKKKVIENSIHRERESNCFCLVLTRFFMLRKMIKLSQLVL